MNQTQKNLTNPQKSIWLTGQFYESSSLFNIGGMVFIKQKVDFDKLERAINLFIKKNEGLRISFELNNGVPYQYIRDFSYEKFPLYSIKSKEELYQLEKDFIHVHFNISKSFLYSFKLVQFEDGTGGFHVVVHHLISDAWSMSLLVSGIINLYSKLLKNEIIDDSLEPSYFEYIASEEKYLTSEKFQKDATFWKNVFQNAPSYASFSLSGLKSTSQEAKRKSFSLENSKEISEFCRINDISVFTFLMTIYSFYLHRITNLDEVIIGSPILNRNGKREKNMMGMFINTLPIKVNFQKNISFLELTKQVAANQFSMFRHHRYPYSELLEFVRTTYQFTNNLYDTTISYQNARNNAKTADVDYSTNWVFNDSISNSLDIHIYDMDNSGTLDILYDYNTQTFKEDEIEDLHARILHIIKQVMQNVEIPIKKIEIVTPEEKQFLLYNFNKTKTPYDSQKCIHELFEEQVRRTPHKVAVAFEDETLTYQELNEKANQLAYMLRTKKGISTHSRVGLLVKRSLEMAVGLLAILKAGAAYIPIDPEYPQERISYMIEDSGASLILVTKDTQNLFSLEHTFNIDFSCPFYLNAPIKNLTCANSSDDLIYLIYTSGSTGKPKGVMLTHKNINNYLTGLKQRIDFSSSKVIVSVTTVCFDIFVTEFWGGLLSGLTVVIANEQEQNIFADLNRLCLKYHVNMIQTTPSRFQLLLDAEELPFLKNITDLMVGGEALPKKLLQKLQSFNWIHVYNMYGPTETAVWSTIKENPELSNITIGTPIANTQVYILDEDLNLLPPNIPGNLYIGGDGVCKGYYHREDLNQKVFIASPFDGSIIYNTNDLAYRRKDGELVHLGRTDFQAKVHGFRVELGEIENAIMKYLKVNYVVVLLQNGDLNAFVLSPNKPINSKDVISHLLKTLPHYMVPKTVTQINSLPLTPNGKIDRKSPIFNAVSKTSESKVKPRNKTEKLLLDLIQKNLNFDIGVTDNMFENGMDSLMIIKIVSQLYIYDINLSIQDFYNYPSIEALAKKLDENPISSHKTKKDSLHLSDITTIQKPILTIHALSRSKNVLLTGVTGFLGIHILHDLLTNTDVNIYCIIRKKDKKTPKDRLIDRLNYYFDGQFIEYINKRIFVLDANITDHYFGLSKDKYKLLGHTISSVIHCAADVRHYGNYEVSEKINIKATDSIIRFCLDFDIILNHISTMTVSGYGLVDVSFEGLFDEKRFYIGQPYQNNIYVKTKFIAEEEIYKAISKGLIANVFRVGNLTNRFSDFKFQFNSNENGFLNKLRTIKNLGILPEELKSFPLELTPVDACAHAIVTLGIEKSIDKNVNIFHLYNPNFFNMDDLVNLLEDDNISVQYLKQKEFEQRIISSLATSKSATGFIDQFNLQNLLSPANSVFSNKLTQNELTNLGFEWPIITNDYMNYIIRRI